MNGSISKAFTVPSSLASASRTSQLGYVLAYAIGSKTASTKGSMSKALTTQSQLTSPSPSY